MFLIWSKNVVDVLKSITKILLSLFIWLFSIIAKPKNHSLHIARVNISLNKFVLRRFYFFLLKIFIRFSINLKHNFIIFCTFCDYEGGIWVFLKIIILFVFNLVCFQKMNVRLGRFFENFEIIIFLYFFNLHKTGFLVCIDHFHLAIRIHNDCFWEV